MKFLVNTDRCFLRMERVQIRVRIGDLLSLWFIMKRQNFCDFRRVKLDN